MLTNRLALTFCSSRAIHDLSLSLKDRHHTLINRVFFDDSIQQSVMFDLAFPNTLLIKVENKPDNGASIYLAKMSLSGLSLTDNILDQICQYRALGSDHIMITRSWHRTGTIKIDFFASNWIQYHLLYGNKITKS